MQKEPRLALANIVLILQALVPLVRYYYHYNIFSDFSFLFLRVYFSKLFNKTRRRTRRKTHSRACRRRSRARCARARRRARCGRARWRAPPRPAPCGRAPASPARCRGRPPRDPRGPAGPRPGTSPSPAAPTANSSSVPPSCARKAINYSYDAQPRNGLTLAVTRTPVCVRL